ncbi:hypothetical protein [Nocardia jiangsuensis]|uniref:DUF3467 domain-containing protein n=1 Tax=Nocardia jiangsuensis TaxID=1691563 RepID=A0ABV8E2Q6_9NOCA
MTYLHSDVDAYNGLEVRYTPERMYTFRTDGHEELFPASVRVDLAGLGHRAYLSLSITDARFLLDELGKALAEHDAAESANSDPTAVDAGKAA